MPTSRLKVGRYERACVYETNTDKPLAPGRVASPVGGAPQGDPHYPAAVASVAEKNGGSRPSESVTVEISRALAAPLKVSGLKPVVARRRRPKRLPRPIAQ